jgi:ABC-type multidrug transport system fused ATPase/permease subunit
MATLAGIFRHTFRFAVQSLLSLLMAILCTPLVLVLPGITMRCIDEIIAKNRPDLILSTAALGIGAIFIRQLLPTLRIYQFNSPEINLTHLARVDLYDKLQHLPVKWLEFKFLLEIMSRVADDGPAIDQVIIATPDESHLTEGERPAGFRSRARFENASFTYAGLAPVINDLTLEALVGATGAGKSTVQGAELIRVLHHKKLIEKRAHAELLAPGGACAKLCKFNFR